MPITSKPKKKQTKESTTNEWTKLKNKKKVLPEPPQEASANLRQIEIPYTRAYRPRYTTRTGRVIQFATRVTPEFDQAIRTIAQQERIHLAEALERMLVAYQESTAKKNQRNNNDKHEWT